MAVSGVIPDRIGHIVSEVTLSNGAVRATVSRSFRVLHLVESTKGKPGSGEVQNDANLMDLNEILASRQPRTSLSKVHSPFNRRRFMCTDPHRPIQRGHQLWRYLDALGAPVGRRMGRYPRKHAIQSD